jgi:hypothetical protein
VQAEQGIVEPGLLQSLGQVSESPGSSADWQSITHLWSRQLGAEVDVQSASVSHWTQVLGSVALHFQLAPLQWAFVRHCTQALPSGRHCPGPHWLSDVQFTHLLSVGRQYLVLRCDAQSGSCSHSTHWPFRSQIVPAAHPWVASHVTHLLPVPQCCPVAQSVSWAHPTQVPFRQCGAPGTLAQWLSLRHCTHSWLAPVCDVTFAQ